MKDHLLGIIAGLAMFALGMLLILVAVATTLIPGVRGQGSAPIMGGAMSACKRAGALMGGGFYYGKSFRIE